MIKKTLCLLGVGAILLLAGCAHPELIDMGESEQSVVEQLGQPHAVTPMPDGTKRLTYSGQPFGQDVWWLFLDGSGKVVAREQGLQEKYFSMIQIGKSTKDDVWALWGPCAEEYYFGLVNEHAWMYRFKDFGGFDMAVWPQFGPDGVIRSMDVTIDPWRDRDANTFF